MSRAVFESALASQPRHVLPFLILGDPTPEDSFALALSAIDAGAKMLELGLPFSDPCADGPDIQAATARAMAARVSTAAALELLTEISRARPQAALNLLVYGNLIHARGIGRACEQLATAGAATLLVPDIPIDEGAVLHEACRDAGVGVVSLVAPSTSGDRLQQMAEASDGYLYLAALQGVTGAQAAPDDAREVLIRRTAAQVSRPLCLGFGLSRPDELTLAFRAGARMAVVGSHLARVIARALEEATPVVPLFLEALDPLLAAADGDLGSELPNS